jgi:hypothetical protein
MVMKVSITPFAAHNSHGQAKQFPRNLSIILGTRSKRRFAIPVEGPVSPSLPLPHTLKTHPRFAVI